MRYDPNTIASITAPGDNATPDEKLDYLRAISESVPEEFDIDQVGMVAAVNQARQLRAQGEQNA